MFILKNCEKKVEINSSIKIKTLPEIVKPVIAHQEEISEEKTYKTGLSGFSLRSNCSQTILQFSPVQSLSRVQLFAT